MTDLPAFAPDAPMGAVAGKWTLMARLADGTVVCEDFTSLTGSLRVGSRTFAKSYERGAAFATNLYRGHTLEQVLD
ncbi:MAG: hypothetical protein J0I48_12800 [Devosia sp.]|nr:hypothetical protein [Devosia sp.]